MIVLGLGVLLSLVYTVWALTARRGIFVDFANGNPVGVGEARSNDRIDTTLLVAAGVVALVALALWLVRRFGGETSGGLVDSLGLGLAVLGAVLVVVGLYIASQVGSAADQAASGDRGVTASSVTAGGFALLALGLVLGLLAVRDGRERTRTSASPTSQGAYQNW
jgi:hypothetical protein